jgi:adenylosuccinate lyase
MRENLELTHGALFSQRLLLALIEQGASRDEAYRVAQELAQRAWDERTPLRELVEADPRCAALDAGAVFDERHYTRHAAAIVARLPA